MDKQEPKKVLTEKDIFNQKDIDAVTEYINKEQQKQHLIDMMKSDEELGLYDDIKANRIELVCKDCSDSLEDCACIVSTIDLPKQEDEFCYYSGLPSPAAYSKEEPNMISDWLEQNRNPEIDKQVEKELEYISRQEIKLEEVFNDEKKENIKKFIDEINNPSEPNDKLKQAFQKYSEYLEDFENKNTYEHGFKDGAKCQQEIMYSEEEVIAFGEFIFKHSLLTHTRGVKSLFEQFKKK